MNRRTSLTYLGILATLGMSSFSLYKLIAFNTPPDLAYLYKKRRLLADLAEVIIPRTETPGAKDAGVQDFIIDMIALGSDVMPQRIFIEGLKDLENYCIETYNKDFFSLTDTEKIGVLKHFESKATYSNRLVNKIKDKLFGHAFFHRLKDLTVEGYCTSQVGATQGLAYDYLPSTYESCTMLTKNQRSWATK